MKKIISRILIAIFLAIAPVTALATDSKPTRSSIKAKVTPQSYASLLKRFNAGEKMAAADAALLYYGSALQPGFNASKKYPEIDKAYKDGATDRTFHLCQTALTTDPTNLALLFKAYVSASLSKDAGLKAQAPKFQTRILTLCDAILESGKGVIDNSPYVVIRPSDIEEYLLKYMQPVKVIGHAKINNLDAYKVDLKGNNDETILYFSIF